MTGLATWSRAAGRVVAGVLLGSVLLAGMPAGATPLGDAKARAAALRLKVDELRQKAEIATEDYDAAYAQLGQAVTAHLSAQKDLDDAQSASQLSDGRAERRVRALYMSGGVPALYAHVLDSATISEVAQRLHQVDVVLAGDRADADRANTSVARRTEAEHRLGASAAASTQLQKQVADRADAVRSLLAQADTLLAQADAKTLALAEQQRREADAAAAARAATVLNQAAYNGPDLPPVAASPFAQRVLDFARSQLGKPYVWGATGPETYDCSGLTGAAYAAAGYHLPRTSREQWFAGPHVALASLEPGDLMFWGYDVNDPSSIHHVAIYAGNGLMVAAPHTGDVVKVQPIYLDGYLGAVRPGSTPTIG